MFIVGCIGLFSGIIFGRIVFPRKTHKQDGVPGPFMEAFE